MASVIALNPLNPQSGDVHGIVLVHYLGGHQGNTEQILALWQHTVASSEALDTFHRAMYEGIAPISMAIE